MNANRNAILIDRASLEALFQRVLEDHSLHVRQWTVDPLHGGLEIGSAIYRLQGVADSAGSARPWSLIVKVIQPDAQHDDPQGYRYWKREARAYQSGLLDDLPGPVAAPRCYQVGEAEDGSVWMWLEDIKDDLGHPWTIEHYGLVARRLGQFNGAELAALVGVAFGLSGVPSSQASSLDKTCFEGYLQGLSDAGWHPDPRQVRLGYTLTMLLRYVVGATIGEMLPGVLDETTRQHWADGVGKSTESVGEIDARVIAYYQSIVIEALRMLGLGYMLRVLGRAVSYTFRLSRERRRGIRTFE